MALLWMDGFDYYAAGIPINEMLRRYGSPTSVSASSWSIDDTDGRYVGAQYLRASGDQRIYVTGLPHNAVVYCGGAHYGETGYTNRILYQWGEGSNRQCYLRVNSDGSINLYNGDNQFQASSTVTGDGGAAGNVLQHTNWYYIEVKMTISATVGACDIIVNGDIWMAATGLDTMYSVSSNVWADYLAFWCPSTGYCYWDDIYIDDAQNHGDSRIITLFPDGDTGTNNWTRVNPASGLYSDHINEVAADDAIYLETNVSTELITVTFDDMPAGSWDIKAVNPLVRCQKVDAGSQDIGVKTDLYAAVDTTIIDTLVYTNDIYETGYTGTSTTAVDAMTLAIEYK